MSAKNSTLKYSLLVLVSTGLTLPLVLFKLDDDPVHLTLLLMPFALLACVKIRNRISLWYSIAILAGLVSVFIGFIVDPEGASLRNLLSLTVIGGTASFLFLGILLARYFTSEQIIRSLSAISGVFIVVVAGRILIRGEPVRTFTGQPPVDFSVMNVEFFGLEVFGTFGILSVTYLMVLQVTIFCGAFVLKNSTWRHKAMLLPAILLGTYLIWGSEARSAQLLVVFIIGATILFALKYRPGFPNTSLIIASVLIGIALSYLYANPTARITDTPDKSTEIASISGESSHTANEPEIPTEQPAGSASNAADSFSSGRLTLIEQAVREIVISPVIGNGFGQYGRFDKSSGAAPLGMNSSSHVYYLTLLWKGGALFMVPFSIFLFLALRSALRRDPHRGPEMRGLYFLKAALVASFGLMVAFWDILLVPSAGALAFFILGTVIEGATASRSQLQLAETVRS